MEGRCYLLLSDSGYVGWSIDGEGSTDGEEFIDDEGSTLGEGLTNSEGSISL
jgi:hypothetical protein